MSNHPNPKIIIKHNRLLDPFFIFYCNNNPSLASSGWNDWTPPSNEEVANKVQEFKKIWEEYGEIILSALSKELELYFPVSMIDVHIIKGTPRDISNPIILKSGHSPEFFLLNLVHELTHRLFAYNELGELCWEIRDSLKDEDITTKKHIMIYSVLAFIFFDVIKRPEILNTHIKFLASGSGGRNNFYYKAWQIVEDFGYEKLIFDFREKIKDR